MRFEEWVKLVFDVVRNYALAAGVALGGSAISQTASVEPDFPFYVGRTLMVLGYVLFLINMFYSVDVFERLPFFAKRLPRLGHFISVSIAVTLGFLLAGAAISFQITRLR